MSYKFNDCDDFQDKTIILHDCVAEKIVFVDGVLRFCFPDGFWVTPLHRQNHLDKTLKTGASVMDVLDVERNAVTVSVIIPTIFKKHKTVSLRFQDLMDLVNAENCSIEFISRNVTDALQIWECEIHSPKKPYHRTCYLHLPKTQTVFRWDDLCVHREW